MKNFSLFVCILILFPSLALAGPIHDCAEYAMMGVPGTDGTLLCRTGYLLAHDGDLKTPIWVAERLTKEKALEKEAKRKDNFKADPNLTPGSRAELADYKGSGYDRGHMAPSADFGWSQEAMDESFLLSNMIPQSGPNNQQIWANLEAHVRDWAIARGTLYIYTGPIYYDDKAEKTIGKNKVGVPELLFKVIYDPQAKEAIAFMLPNEPIDTKDLPLYIVPVRHIEYMTGLNFLSKLPRKEQNRIEKASPTEMW
jgi:endonuclease G